MLLVRLTTFLLALSVLTAAATVDLRAADSGVFTSHSASMEDGPEGEEAPLAMVAGGGDLLLPGHRPSDYSVHFHQRPEFVNWALPAPSHPAFAGFPTGPPAA